MLDSYQARGGAVLTIITPFATSMSGIAHFVGLYGGTLNAMTIANVPPNLPTITWAATLDPGYHSFPKWAKACRTGVIFLRFSGERGQERGKREVRDMRYIFRAPSVACVSYFALASHLPPRA